MADAEPQTFRRSTRDPGVLQRRMRDWVATRLPEGANPDVSEVTNPSATGMSSETLLFEASWIEDGKRHAHALVARLAPDPADEPVFPVYDLEMQYRVMELVAARSRVPAPPLRWLELDATHLGAPFLVMDRLEGRVPGDNPPYAMAGWLVEADAADRKRLQDASVGVLADLHAIDVGAVDTDFLEFDLPGDTPMRRHFENQRRYHAWASRGRSFPVIERSFAWLEANWPEQEGPTVISWGDSRVGNIMYDGFAPKAVFDWEMAGLAPRGVDVGWMVFMHQFFEDILQNLLDHASLPDFLRREDVAAEYARRSGHDLPDLPFYEVYAALRHGIIMTRITTRSVHFGESEWPEDADACIPHRGILERMLDGSYWAS